MNNSKIYFLFSIGPVQEFIAAGRKTRDLFSGSLMLSYLSAKALDAVRKHANINGYNAVAVFPSVNEEKNYADSSVPNRFLFSITEYSVDKITNTAEAAENTIYYEFDRIVEHAKRKFATINERDKVWTTYWDEQKNNFLEIYWAAMETNEDYSMIYNRLENLMGQRKVLRNFNELNNGNNEKGQPGLKCSLIQNLSAVHPTKEKPNDFWRDVIDKYPHLIGDLTGKEPLSAIALAKRFFIDYLSKNNAVKDGIDKYPSTTTIAVSTFNKAIINNYPKISDDAKSNIKEFVKAVRALQEAKYGPRGKINITNMPFLIDKNTELKDYLKIEGDFLFEEMVKNEFKSSGHEIEGKIRSVNETAKQIIKEVKKISDRSISKYYAIIYFDGDKMGEKLSSENVTTISENLRRFSTRNNTSEPVLRNVYQVIEEDHLGKVVYSGGDDVLAFISLEDCLSAAFALRKSFTGFMGTGYEASAGIAIAHHQTDLKQVLNAARKAEEYAKSDLGRNSLAIALMKRSGISTITGTKWYYDEEKNNIDSIVEFSEFIRNGKISTGFIFDLINELDGLSVFEESIDAILPEIKRLLYRHSDKKDVEKFYEDKLKSLCCSFIKEFKENPLNQLCGILEVAQFIGQGGER